MLCASCSFYAFILYLKLVVGVLGESVICSLGILVLHCHFTELTGFSNTEGMSVVAVQAISCTGALKGLSS